MINIQEEISILLKKTILNISDIKGGLSNSNKFKIIFNHGTVFCKIYSFGDEIEKKTKLNQLKTVNLMFNNIQEINKIHPYKIYITPNKIYTFQEYIEGNNIDIGNINIGDIKKIARLIGSIHQKKLNKHLSDIQKIRLYKESLKKILVDEDMIFGLLRHIGKIEKEIIIRMIQEYSNNIYNINPHRLSILHGDFWHENIIKNKVGNIFLCDLCRIPYGEAGIDVGTFIANLEIEYLITEKEKYINMSKAFIKEYIKITKDNDIIKHMNLGKLFVLYLFIIGKGRIYKDKKSRGIIYKKYISNFIYE